MRQINPNSLKNLEKGVNTQLKSGDPRTKAIQSMGGRAISRKRHAQAVFRHILESVPRLDDDRIEALASAGITSTDDVDLQTIIGVAIALKAAQGDTRAAQLAFTMAGETPEARFAEKRLKLDKQRLDLEVTRLELERQANTLPGTDPDYVDPFITALNTYGERMTKDASDTPEGTERPTDAKA